MAKPAASLALAAVLAFALVVPAASQTVGDIALGKRLYQAKA